MKNLQESRCSARVVRAIIQTGLIREHNIHRGVTSDLPENRLWFVGTRWNVREVLKALGSKAKPKIAFRDNGRAMLTATITATPKTYARISNYLKEVR